MTTTHLADGEFAEAIGVIPASGVAFILVLVLVYGVIGKGRRKLNSGPAQIVGMFAEIAFLRSEAPFLDAGEAIQSIPVGLSQAEGLGAPGMPTVCLILIVIAFFARIVPIVGAFLGLILGAAFEAADGSIWNAVVSILSVPLNLPGF